MAKAGESRATGGEAERVRLLAAAIAHPLRLKLLTVLAADSPLGADALSARVEEPIREVRRQLKSLVSSGLVGVVGGGSRSGEAARYSAIEGTSRIDAEELALLSERDRRRSALGGLRLIFAEATKAAGSSELGKRADNVLVNFSRRVDERGWGELTELHQKMLDQVTRTVAESRERLESGGGEAVGIISDQILLEAPQNAADEPRMSPPRPGGMPPRQGRLGEVDVQRARRLAAVIAHPLRARLLVVMGPGVPMGADVIAERLDEPLHRVRRHLNALVAADIIAVASEENRRGAIKRYFAFDGRAMLDTEENALISERDRRRVSIGMIRLIFEAATRAASNPQLGERADHFIANVSNRVDERGWRELSELHHEMLEQMTRVIAASQERLEPGEEEPIGIVSTQILLEAPQNAVDP